MRHLQFVFHLPVETNLEKIDLYWFNLNHSAVEYETDEVMLLYTVPYLLRSQRQVHNHAFGRRLTINNKINHIEWVIDRDPLSINTTLTHFQHVHSLMLYYDIHVKNQCNSISILIDLDCLGNESKSMFLASSTSSFTSC